MCLGTEIFGNPIIAPSRTSESVSTADEQSVEQKGNEYDRAIQDLKGKVARLEQVAVKACRVCFKETEGSSQCQGYRYSCSGWSTSPDWTLEFRDDTDNRAGGCQYHWMIECQPLS